MTRRDSKLKIGIILITGLAGAILANLTDMRFPISELTAPVAVVVCLGPCAVFYQKRKTSQFVLPLLAVMHILVFTACFTLLMYATAALSMPLVDEQLAAVDRWFHVYVPDIVSWAVEHPLIAGILWWSYHTVLPQTLFLVIGLGFADDREQLELFVLRFMVALLITVSIFALAPAEGPFVHYDIQTSPAQQRYLEHLTTLRSGARTELQLQDSEGLVTFPSFHTTWAILLAAAVWHRRRIFLPVCLLNLCVIAATMTTGWHYFSDVLGGILVGAIVIALTRRLYPWLNSSSVEPVDGIRAPT
ncbi:MAG: phosphatase PAP2 family protein [Planctomycetaceae bacterium]